MEFGIALIKYYKSFLTGTSEAIKELAEIQSKYKKEYAIIRELKDDPRVFVKLSDDMPPEVKQVLFSIIIEASLIGEKANKLYDLSPQEQQKLADSMVQFGNKVEVELNKLINMQYPKKKRA